jgi:hypothetical protein
MIEPADALAFSMHANKGVYAIILGSGVSRAARIPTGWEITLELVRKLAAVRGEDCEPDPVAWCIEATGRTPDYSELLDALAKTPAERQQLLRSYWEPTEQEREEGAKLPTKAHRAIADLIKLGYVRVILTTNFDRLIETALQDVGIAPTVLSSPDHIAGALPLIHTPCTLIKIHGDYLDTRIRNTPDELSSYPEEFNKLLDRVFDEFGLIVAGWSADWDDALRTAMTRAPYRRFSTYWASRGTPSAKATDLIERRGATLVPITDADAFFVSVAERVKALEEFSRPHPISKQAAIASLKKYLSEDRYRISLDDLISTEADRALKTILAAAPDVNNRDVNAASVERCVQGYEAAMELMIEAGFVAGRWSTPSQLEPWRRALTRFARKAHSGGVVVWLELQRYPATLLLYGLGIGTVFAQRWDILGLLLSTGFKEQYQKEKRIVDVAPVLVLFDSNPDVMKLLPGRERQYLPLNNRLHDLLSASIGSAFSSSDAFTLAFDWFEVLAGLSYGIPAINDGSHYWAPPGAFAYRHENREAIFASIKESLTQLGDSSPFVTSGIVGASTQIGLENVAAFMAKLQHMPRC